MLAEPAALARPEADGAAPPVARGWRLPLVPLETIHVKGKQEPITVHTIVPELAEKPDALRDVRAIQTRLAQDGANPETLVARVVALAPGLSKYYALRQERRHR